MRITRSRVAAFVLAGAAVVAPAGTDARAQACLAGPFVTGPIPAAPTFLAAEGFGALGDNLVEIPAFSPVNDPASPLYGFAGLCAIFGLGGTFSTIVQLDAETGVARTHVCNSPVAPAFQPCQAVLIRPTVAAAGVIPPGPAGLEGSWLYLEYGDVPGALGDSLFGIPRTTPPGTTPDFLCLIHALPPGTTIYQIDPFAGVISTHACGAAPTWALAPGGAVLIRAPGPPGVAVAGGIF
jgi:hypothetical protein